MSICGMKMNREHEMTKGIGRDGHAEGHCNGGLRVFSERGDFSKETAAPSHFNGVRNSHRHLLGACPAGPAKRNSRGVDGVLQFAGAGPHRQFNHSLCSLLSSSCIGSTENAKQIPHRGTALAHAVRDNGILFPQRGVRAHVFHRLRAEIRGD